MSTDDFYHQLRARRVLMLANNVPECCFHCLNSMALVPFWFSTEHCWTMPIHKIHNCIKVQRTNKQKHNKNHFTNANNIINPLWPTANGISFWISNLFHITIKTIKIINCYRLPKTKPMHRREVIRMPGVILPRNEELILLVMRPCVKRVQQKQ